METPETGRLFAEDAPPPAGLSNVLVAGPRLVRVVEFNATLTFRLMAPCGKLYWSAVARCLHPSSARLGRILKKPLEICLLLGLMTAPDPAAPAEESVPDSVTKYRFLGKNARVKKQHDDVVKYYTELIKYDPGYHWAHYSMGRAFLELGREADAQQALLAAAALDSTHLNTNLSLYTIYLNSAAPDSAWRFLAPVIRAKPGEVTYLEYRQDIADLYRRKGLPQEAIEHYTALSESPALPEDTRNELYELLAVMNEDQGDAAAALAWRQRLAPVSGAGQIESLTRIVDLQIQTEDYKGAHATLKELASIDSAGRYAHYARMSELGDTAGDPAVRLEGLEGMAREQPKDLVTVATIAEIHLNADDLEAAAGWIVRGLGRVPGNAHLRLLRGDLLLRQGAEEEAIAEYERARKDPNWAAVAQQRIWQLRPPETEEEKLRREFFGGGDADEEGSTDNDS